MKRTYAQLKERARERVAEQLRKDIDALDGTARTMREVEEGMEAAEGLGLDLAPFTSALKARQREIAGRSKPAHHGRRRAAS